jgi:Asp-tRNA(Asn)/Glu-tRNA(Gln) amidotransferase A subunit family amidase
VARPARAGARAAARRPGSARPAQAEVVWEVEHGLAYTALDVSRAAAVRQRWVEAVGALFERFDAVLAPSTQVFPFAVTTRGPRSSTAGRMDTYHRWMETVMPWSMAGTPVLGMPAGSTRAACDGVQLVGPPGATTRCCAGAPTRSDAVVARTADHADPERSASASALRARRANRPLAERISDRATTASSHSLGAAFSARAPGWG